MCYAHASMGNGLAGSLASLWKAQAGCVDLQVTNTVDEMGAKLMLCLP